MNLYEASNQWATRPPDERFFTVPEMLSACKRYFERACEATIPRSRLQVTADGSEVKLVGQDGGTAKLSYWAFSQLALKAHAPASYLRTLPAELVASCLNQGFLSLAQSRGKFDLMFHRTEDEHHQLPLPHAPSGNPLLLRAITTEKYTRIWNWEIADRLTEMVDQGWRVPPARPAHKAQPGTRVATEADALDGKGSLSINVGDLIAPAGLYASDHDIFAFLVFEKNRVKDNSSEGLSRGVFFENSEVGARSLRCTTFLYRHVCGNHIVWDSRKVVKLSIKHVGKARRKFSTFVLNMTKYAEASAKTDELRITRAIRKRIGRNKEEALSKLFSKLRYMVSLETLDEAFETAETNAHIDGDPLTAWGMAQGLTRLSQRTPFADERAQLDRVAGRVLRIGF